jgi:hypothetical protein
MILDCYTALTVQTDTVNFLITPLFGINLFTIGVVNPLVSESGAPGVSPHVNNMHNASELLKNFRTISLGVRVTPLGPPVNQSGIVTIGRVAFTKTAKERVIGVGDRLSYVVPEDIYTDRASLMKDSQAITFPLTEGGFATANNEANSYLFGSPRVDDATLFNFIGGTPFSEQVDWDYGALVVSVEGAGTAAKFMVETMHCVEAVPNLGSVLGSVAKNSPTPNTLALRSVAIAKSRLPIGSILKDVARFAAQASAFIPKIGPIVAPIASSIIEAL